MNLRDSKELEDLIAMRQAYPSKFNCPNKSKHISAFPAFDRIICPYCRQVFVLKYPEREQIR
jgi:hypothetical protein